MDVLLEATVIEDLLYKLTILVTAVLGAVVLLLFAIVWAKFSDLPLMSKVFLALALSMIVVAIIWITTPGLLADQGVTAEALRSLMTHMWREVDGFARSHQWIGLALLVSIPFLLWPTDDELEN